MKRKIAIFQTDLLIGGIQKSLINLLNSIDYTNYEIDLYLFNKNKFFSENIPETVNIVFLNPQRRIFKLLPFQFLNRFYKSTIVKNYDVAIDYNGYSNDTALAMINTVSKKKVMWIHSDLKERKRKDIKYKMLYFASHEKYKYVDQFVMVSNAVKESFTEMQKSKIKSIVIPNILLTDYIISESKKKTNIKVNQNNLNLVSVGRLCYAKGFDILINYMSEVSALRDDVHLYIIGSGPDEIKIKKRIKKLNLGERVHLLGAQQNPYSIMKEMDAFVLTSRYEGQGIVILEAKVLGLPIFITSNLDKYVSALGVKGSDDFVNDIAKFEKKPNKKTDSLKDYNESIIRNINKVLGE
ncbi:MAG: glycosyltransferase [Bacilli bacterium]|nr:glycosyltransferase [Bacilli bacterium]